MTEAEILAKALLAIGSLPNVRVSRNNVGAAFDRTGRLIRYGLFGPGGSDIVGFRSLVITPDMAGQRIAIFTAIEAKTDRGRLRPEQQAFLHMVNQSGGIAGVIRSPDDAVALIGGFSEN